jgi:hypothetical protein
MRRFRSSQEKPVASVVSPAKRTGKGGFQPRPYN